MANHHSNPSEDYDPITYIPHSESHGTKEIWMTFIYLTAITVFDIFFYFAMSPSLGRNWLFIGLGIVKAFLIIGTFMHLKYERINLILSILIPFVFIIWLVIWLLFEGNAIHLLR